MSADGTLLDAPDVGARKAAPARACDDCDETIGPGERRRRCGHCALHVCWHCYHHVHALGRARARQAAL